MTSLNSQNKQEKAGTDIINEIIGESVDDNSKKEVRETKYYNSEAKFKEENHEIYVTEVDISYEKYPVKSEPVDGNEEQDVSDSSYVFTYKVAEEDLKIEIKPEYSELCEQKFIKTVKEDHMNGGESFDNESNKQSVLTKALCTEEQVIRPDKKRPKTRAQISKEYRERQKIKKQTASPSVSSTSKASTAEVQVIRPDKKTPKTRAQISKEYRERQKVKKQAPPRTASQNTEDSAGPQLVTVITTSNNIPINKSRNQAEATLSSTWYNMYDSHLHMTEETVEAQLSDQCSKETIGESANKTCNEDNTGTELYETKAEIKVEFKNQKLNCNDYRSPIKDRILTNSTDISKAVKYENTTTDNFYVSDLCNISQTVSTRTSNVNSNNLIPTDTESLKKLFICDICNKRFHCKSTLIRHIRKHPKMYNCTYCSYKSYVISYLNQHVNARHTKSTSFNCPYCNYKSYHKRTLNSHINSQHTKNSVFSCSDCTFKAYQKSTLDLHINSQHTKRTVFNCSYCSYKAYRKSHLDQHVNAQHTKRTVFNCSECSFKTYQKTNLGKHVKYLHTKNTVFNCSYCSYKAYRKSCLSNHINSQHTKSTIFNCPSCNYKAYRKNYLDQHINSQHTKNTFFNCSYCSYKAYQKHHLNNHINSKHTKSAVFSCSNCSYKTYNKFVLSKHIQRKHS